MQPPKLPSPSPASEWEAVSGSNLEELPPSPLREIIIGPDSDPPELFPTRFSDSSVERAGLAKRHALAHNATVAVGATGSASLPGPGEWIGDAYYIESALGGGSMGVVFCALDKALGRRVAVKLIRSNSRPGDFRRRFMLEARAMALVSHPNVLTIHAFGEHQGNPFIVMELVTGETLETWHHGQGPATDLDAALRILNQICLGVSAIHAAGTVHRDLKPSNILLDRELRARVSDLGLAVCTHEGAMVKEVVGTPGYIAPEIQFGDGGGATAQSDLYSLACMAYELLTGSPPFEAELELDLALQHATDPVPPPSGVRPELPKAFDDVLLSALAKNPAQRTTSVELFRRALMEARNDSLEPVRILVAEDDPDFLEVLELVLRREFPGVDIECVSDGRSAVQAFDRKPASVVMIDLHLPEFDGMAVTALLRARPSANAVPIIVVTASGGPKEWRLLSSLGADRFIVKPVNLDDLVSTIRRAARERSRHSL
ncbi:MAG TPA: protein kinase, partial [Polyangiaceae bacterium]|nr:protein kinase [Polyangiaceae bacterium]